MNGQAKISKRHKWSLDLSSSSKSKDRQVSSTLAQELSNFPLGYTERSLAEQTVNSSNSDLIVKRSWDIALGPLKQVPMNLFIMWMAGNSISIFPIMMVGMMFIRPIQALVSVQQTFKMIEGGQATVQKFVYFIGNVACLALAVYKCQVMGLLPTHPSDWLAFVQPQKRMEWSGGGLVL